MLEQAGLVEIVAPAGGSASKANSTPSRRAKAQQPIKKDVVSKLIDKIKSI